MLLKEEMRRNLAFLSWRSMVWRGRVSMRTTTDSALAEGLVAYAEEQADLQEE